MLINTKQKISPRWHQEASQGKADKLSGKDSRIKFNSYYSIVCRILSQDTSPLERTRLISELDLSKAISDIENFLGIKNTTQKLTVSSKPTLIEGLGNDYSEKWSFIIKALKLLGVLYKSKANRTSSRLDLYKGEFFRNYHDVIKWIYNGAGNFTDRQGNDIRARLRNLAQQYDIGRSRFTNGLEGGANLLSLALWIGREQVLKTYPMPDFDSPLKQGMLF